ncbi:MAG: helix-turn-helix domain-containing protein, partial [Balneolaceae bacterium]|nr:helix-turn-helix domain-containing protein [Balneolaceae bacterium]
EDLYYRLHVFPIELPPLRERGEDVLLLAEAFIERSARRFNRRLLPLDNADKRLLRSYRWPGNIRELQNIIERAVITASDGHLNLSQYLGDTDLKQKKKDHTDTGEVKTAKELEQLERQNMIRALEATGWKVSGQDGAASLIGIPPTTFSSRMKALEIERPS